MTIEFEYWISYLMRHLITRSSRHCARTTSNI